MIPRMALTFFFFSVMLMAGDTAEFCSLGWSSDYGYYAFAQFGEQDGSGFPYADLFVVDVAKNDFVKNGVFNHLWKEDVDTAAKGLHALLSLYVEADSVLAANDISGTRHVRPAFANKEKECTTAQWTFNDMSFSIEVQQESKGDPGSYESEAAFQIRLQAENQEPITIGNKDRFRKYVMRYDIDRILHAPENNAIVIVIRITRMGFEGPDIRYMVETIKLP